VPRDCSLEEPIDCLIGVCDEDADVCTTEATDEGLPCNDGNACNTGETCTAGSCTGGNPVTCPDNGDPCTDLACDPGGSEGNCDLTVNVNENGPCDDGLACNVGETCVAGQCQGGGPGACPDNNDPCSDLQCDPAGAEGNCDTVVNVNEGGPCDDGDRCTDDTCVAGSCVGTPIDCSDGDECTVDFCAPATGSCFNVPDPTVACDDGDACTLDTCDPAGGTCLNVPDPNIDCDDGDACTLDSCDPADGSCLNVPDTSIDCDDNNACTTDSCNPADGSCINAVTITCDDGNACTTDVCNPANGSCSNTVSVVCNDNSACTNDSCDPATGTCRFVKIVTCNDADPCTGDVCDPGTGACIFEDNGLCGACCLPDGGCTDGGTYPDCIAVGGEFRQQQECLGDNDGDGREDLCRASVPAVSEWGTVALSLLLLFGVAIKFGCDRKRAL
jgi:hypothetical protein